MSLTLGNNFEWALQRLKEGKKVRREVWKGFNGYIFISSSGNLVYSENTYSNRDYTVNSKGINATDWELVEERSLSERIFLNSLDITHVKFFIKKILEDINGIDFHKERFPISRISNIIYKYAGDKLI